MNFLLKHKRSFDKNIENYLIHLRKIHVQQSNLFSNRISMTSNSFVRDERNLSKSRYRDVIPGEATRVKLQPDYDDKSDFINANYVSGYNNQEKAYIFTQGNKKKRNNKIISALFLLNIGPLESTVKDFWRMVWQENIVIIVMTTNIRESNTIKCYPYWPSETKAVLNAGLYQIQNEESERFSSFIVTKLSLRKKNHSDVRTIYHTHYIKWPDHGIPPNTNDALDFLERVNYYKRLTQTQAPILVHCSAGIGRTGTFCAIDIGIKRYLEKMNIDMPATVMKMRSERAGSVQTEDQYVFAHLALMDYIKQHEQTTTTTADNDLPDVRIKTGNSFFSYQTKLTCFVVLIRSMMM